MNDDIGIGVIGLGGMGTLHARTFDDLGASIIAGADPLEAKRHQFESTFDCQVYTTHDALLEDDRIEAVVVTTPNRYHEPITVDALNAGRHVLVEKPLAHSLDSAERIAAVAENAQATCMVGFHNRHAGSMTLFEEYDDQGRFGSINHVEAQYVRRRGVPGPGSWFTDDDLAGGGALLDIGVHALDLALAICDFPDVVEVSGRTRSTFGDTPELADPEQFGSQMAGESPTYHVDDSVSAFIRCANGKTISLEAAWATNREPSKDVIVRGTDGGATFEIGDTELHILEAGSSAVDHYADVHLTADPSATGYTRQDRQFLECVATGANPTTNTVEQAVTVQQVIDAIYRSSETSRAQRLDEKREQLAD